MQALTLLIYFEIKGNSLNFKYKIIAKFTPKQMVGYVRRKLNAPSEAARLLLHQIIKKLYGAINFLTASEDKWYGIR